MAWYECIESRHVQRISTVYVFFSVPSVSEKMAELAKLQSELEMQRSAVSQITELKAQLDAQKQKNNVRKTWQWV